MAEPHRKSGPFRIQISFSFDRLLEPKLAQAYDILVPGRERPVGVRVKEFDDENGGDLRAGFLRAATRGEHDCESDGVAARVRPQPRAGGTQRMVFDTSIVVPLRSSSCLSPDLVIARPLPSAFTTMAFGYSRRRWFETCS